MIRCARPVRLLAAFALAGVVSVTAGGLVAGRATAATGGCADQIARARTLERSFSREHADYARARDASVRDLAARIGNIRSARPGNRPACGALYRQLAGHAVVALRLAAFAGSLADRYRDLFVCFPVPLPAGARLITPYPADPGARDAFEARLAALDATREALNAEAAALQPIRGLAVAGSALCDAMPLDAVLQALPAPAEDGTAAGRTPPTGAPPPGRPTDLIPPTLAAPQR